MKKREAERVTAIIERLKLLYPAAECSLEYAGEAWKLLVMARLSAQCTDARVNEVCKTLFSVFPTLESMADAPLAELEELVKSCGFYRAKAANIKDALTILRDSYNGRVPDTMEELLALPGVGRKIANLMLGDIFGKPAVVADTHCIRISGRLGLAPKTKDAPKVEFALKAILPPAEQSDFCHRMVLFGREICTARAPKCANCPLSDLCPKLL